MNSDNNLGHILSVAKNAAVNAGKKALEIKKSTDFIVHSKKDNSQVTAGDYAADKIVKSCISDNFPDHIILSEESSECWDNKKYLADHLWIIDPIDGTTNYVYEIPHSAVSIAYAENGHVKAAVVYNFFIDQLFCAIKGSGAYLNESQIKCNSTARLCEALVATGLPYQRPVDKNFEQRIINVANNCRDLRRLAAASLDLCYVACGRLDAYFETVSSWDMAAGTLIAKEAGCSFGHTKVIKDPEIPVELDGQDLLVSCPGIFEDMKKLLSY